jgi:hypothetical protein
MQIVEAHLRVGPLRPASPGYPHIRLSSGASAAHREDAATARRGGAKGRRAACKPLSAFTRTYSGISRREE